MIALAVSTAMLALLVAPTAFADEDVTVDVTIAAGSFSLTAQAGGQWADGMTLVNVATGATPTISEWANGVTLRADLSGANDYLNFTDETATDGFYVEIDTTDLSNAGDAEDIAANDAVVLYAQHADPDSTTAGSDGTAPVKATADVTTEATNMSATSATTCTSAEDGSGYSFHAEFNTDQSTPPYSYAVTNTATEIITSTVECPNNGIIRFDRLEWTVPSGYALGAWSSTLGINIFDGASS